MNQLTVLTPLKKHIRKEQAHTVNAWKAHTAITKLPVPSIITLSDVMYQ